eukprot:813588_1
MVRRPVSNFDRTQNNNKSICLTFPDNIYNNCVNNRTLRYKTRLWQRCCLQQSKIDEWFLHQTGIHIPIMFTFHHHPYHSSQQHLSTSEWPSNKILMLKYGIDGQISAIDR